MSTESFRTDSYRGDGTAEDVLAWAFAAFNPAIALACSFSAEDVVLAHMAQRLQPAARVFALDTGRLPQETYECAEALRARGLAIEWHFPARESVEDLLRRLGPCSFRLSLEARHECCRIRKVEPLGRALRGLAAWITGLRREQSETRATIDIVEHDDAHGGMLKINPLAAWSDSAVWEYMRAYGLPRHRLYDAGYQSIGCAPCTRATRSGEHPRAGRWWWEKPEHKECGLHARPVPTDRRGSP